MTETAGNSYLAVLQSRIDELADQAGIAAAARSSLDGTLAALPKSARRRLFMFLESLRAFSPDPAQRAAVRAVQQRAVSIWGDEAPEILGAMAESLPAPPAGGTRRPSLS